ncbi:AAA family ATPase [Bradyrhizobium sp. INPA01-394B]|uniref:non-specific protein-tyrosine kinase n=1 Tax=Bradyrhizobium campsiandrae TaxID=1729892 RepID=A0ABR7UB43_9BRAD|nr:AAA family ATPase [Bradyrhizobium campsiandrae]MBC9879341.1 AAA family ATPase [Bradyrhizobium campsiandrae]MBC9980729.1 AAA family ATPase [Bradyrhizobium campsiandrae]
MDMISRAARADYRNSGADAPDSLSTLLERLTGLVRRQYRLLLAIPLAALAIGALYLVITPPQYTATTTLLIDSSTLRVLQNQLQPQGDVPLDTLQVGSQVEILMSRKIALAVVRELHLADDPDFTSNRGPFGFLTGAAGDSSDDRELLALDQLMRNRAISRGDKTYVLNIAYTSRSPDTAARIANALADAYIDDQLEAKFRTVNRASVWLQDRINELKTKATSADRAVLEFKERNKIVDLGGSNGPGGNPGSNRLIGDQQAIELSSQLASARGSTSEAKARLDRVEQIQKMDVGQAAVADVLKNEVITRLRNQYLDLSAREASLSSRYGIDHEAAANVRAQMEEARRNISAELGRILASARSDYQVAKTREENLERALNDLVSEGQLLKHDRLGLAELESTAKVYHSLYDSFLQRYMEAIQQQSFPITDARVISAAVPPTQKSRPISSLVLVIALTFGLLAGIGTAVLREAMDGVFRTGRQAEEELGLRCLSVVPMADRKAAPGSKPASRKDARRPGPASVLASRYKLPSLQGTPAFQFADPMKRTAADQPLSAFAEAIRRIKIRVSLEASIRNNKVIGVTSSLPGEGKSTVACNLATLTADAGKRVILVDADLRNPTLGQSLTPQPSTGWLGVLNGTANVDQVIGFDADTGLSLLPVVLTEALLHSDEILASAEFAQMIDALRERFDYVILDLPPTAPVIDVRVALPLIDSVVFVVKWGSTSIASVRRQFGAEPELHERILGVVLNMADPKLLRRFEQPDVSHYGYYSSPA